MKMTTHISICFMSCWQLAVFLRHKCRWEGLNVMRGNSKDRWWNWGASKLHWLVFFSCWGCYYDDLKHIWSQRISGFISLYIHSVISKGNHLMTSKTSLYMSACCICQPSLFHNTKMQVYLSWLYAWKLLYLRRPCLNRNMFNDGAEYEARLWSQMVSDFSQTVQISDLLKWIKLSCLSVQPVWLSVQDGLLHPSA